MIDGLGQSQVAAGVDMGAAEEIEDAARASAEAAPADAPEFHDAAERSLPDHGAA